MEQLQGGRKKGRKEGMEGGRKGGREDGRKREDGFGSLEEDEMRDTRRENFTVKPELEWSCVVRLQTEHSGLRLYVCIAENQAAVSRALETYAQDLVTPGSRVQRTLESVLARDSATQKQTPSKNIS